jgi:tRNA threonylcarbamoyladenosine biosynthesis protein TsaE
MHDAHLTHFPLIQSIALPDEAATLALGARFAQPACLAKGLSIWLHGDLGAGKTTFVRGLLRALGDTGPVKSPTYTLLEVHAVSGLNLYHFDFYRFESPEEFLDAGLGEYFNDASVCLVEWPERAQGCVPSPDLRLRLHHAGVGRIVEALADTPKGEACLNALIPAMGADDCCTTPAPR